MVVTWWIVAVLRGGVRYTDRSTVYGLDIVNDIYDLLECRHDDDGHE